MIKISSLGSNLGSLCCGTKGIVSLDAVRLEAGGQPRGTSVKHSETDELELIISWVL